MDGGIIGYINNSKYNGKYIRITTVGVNAGTVTVVNGKFSLAQNNGILIPKLGIDTSLLSYEYIQTQLKGQLPQRVKGNNQQKSLLKPAIENVEISIPIKPDGSYDLATQIEISKKFEEIEMKRQILLDDKQKLLSSTVDIDISSYSYHEVSLKTIFDLSQTSNGSKFTKTFIKANEGTIPVYGASKFEDEVGYGYIKDNAEIIEKKNGKETRTKVRYFENCLTYNIDGTAGYVFYRKDKFSLSEKVKPLIIVDEYKKHLDANYLKYILQPIFRINTRGRKGPNGENEFSKISRNIIENLFIPIPIKEDGTFDLETQKLISDKYQKAENIKNALSKQIDDVLRINVEM